MSEPIDWLELTRDIRKNKPPAYNAPTALVAIEQIIGEDVLRQAVNYYVALKPECELARQVLWQLRPYSAMQRCYEIFRSDVDIKSRRTAIELLRVIADERALDWMDEFLADPDLGIQNWAMGILDQMLFGGGIRNNEPAMEKVDRLLASTEAHASPTVRAVAARLRADEAQRKAHEDAWDEFYQSKKRKDKEG